MKFIIILVTSLLLLIAFRSAFILIYKLLCKIFNASEKIGFQFTLSIAFLAIYVQTISGAVQGVLNKSNISNTTLQLF